MKANEIRIGNYYQDRYGNYHIVEELSKSSFVDDHFDRGVSTKQMLPIPLTEEILLKAGFEKEYEDDRYGRVFLVPNTKYIIRIVNYGNPQKVDFGYSLEISDDKNWSDIKRIYFIHELQNLIFALTGEEIKIDLE